MIAISEDNLSVLEHVFKRKMKAGMKITITVENLAAVMEAARLDERANLVGKQLDAALDTLRGPTRSPF